MDIRPKDQLVMKKPHPCGEKRWLVLRTVFFVIRSGMDFRLRCTTCGREFLIPRSKIERHVRQVIRPEQDHAAE